MFNPIASDLWELSRPLKVPGLKMEHRMTVVKLRSGGLWVHSPVEYDEGLARELAELGTIESFVAPNTWHDLYWGNWFRHYPDSRFFCAPGVREQHPELPFHNVFGSGGDNPWPDEMDVILLRGMPRFNEVVFRHRPSRSLIVADLVFNLSVQQNVLGRLLLKLDALYGRPGSSRIFRWFIKDRSAFRASLEEVLRWDFDRLIIGHGTIVETGGKDALRKAYHWLLPAR